MAVAMALAVPTAVLAQSAVTISGTFKVGIDNLKIDDGCTTAACAASAGTNNGAVLRTGRNTRETRVTDNSSQIHFNVTEDLGAGMAGIAKLDLRFAPDEGGTANNASGNTWVGIRSTGFGTITFGRHDLHYGKQPDDVPTKGALMASSVSLMDYAAGGTVAVANATRTPNVIRWDSPAFGGINVTAAYSTSAGGIDNDLTHGDSAGKAWNINPSFTGPNFQVGYSHWDMKSDNADAAATTNPGRIEQKSDVLYGFMRFGPFKVGAAINKSNMDVAGTEISDRTNWTIPVSWTMGRNTVAATFTQAGEDDAFVAGGDDTKARMIALMYAFDFSKRTSLSFTYAQIRNEDNAAYDFFTNCGGSTIPGPTSVNFGKATGGFGSTGSCTNFGEDPKLMAVTLRHTF
jgi:predicted porin